MIVVFVRTVNALDVVVAVSIVVVHVVVAAIVVVTEYLDVVPVEVNSRASVLNRRFSRHLASKQFMDLLKSVHASSWTLL